MTEREASERRRRDWAVVLARGESRRMGRPKGLCSAPDDPRPFLQRVYDLYTLTADSGILREFK